MLTGSALTNQSIASGGVDDTVDQILLLQAAESILQETGGLLTATGQEQTMYTNNAPIGVHEPRTLIVDLDNMLGGDTTVLRVYYRITSGGGLQLHDYQSYTGADGGLANSIKLVSIGLLPNRFGLRITLDQTAGTNRTYRWEYFEEANP